MATRKTAKPNVVRKKSNPEDKSETDPTFAPVVAAFAEERQVKRGRMFSSNSVLNVNGKIFAMLSKGKLVVKLPKVRVDQLVSGGVGTHFDPGHGRLMKEWVVVGQGKLDWVDLAREAYRFVRDARK